MMGKQPPPQGKLFYANINIDKRVRANHPLRKVDDIIDFDFIYEEVKDSYGSNGNVSIPPSVILKLMLLLLFYNVRSERELMETLPERIDWLWFLGYDFDTEIPDHSVLSKARKRWGAPAFKGFFERIVLQCCEAGLVNGSKVFVDSSLIEADASNNSIVDTHSLKRHLNKSYREFEKRLEEAEASNEDENDEDRRNGNGKVNSRYLSTTDPDASIVRHGGKPKLRYQTHRMVDGAFEIITATEVTGGDVNEAHRLTSLMDKHQTNTGRPVETAVADTKYGTIANFLACKDRGINAHIPDFGRKQANRESRKKIFSEDCFTYDKESDTYLCPASKRLKRRSLHIKRQSIDYSGTKKLCGNCELKIQCTTNKSGRTITHHLRQEDIDRMRELSNTPAARQDIKTRQHLMERSFARAKRYGYKRARWRGNWKVEIQEYLTAAIQNIEVLIRYGKRPKKCAAIAMEMKNRAEKEFTKLRGSIRMLIEQYFPIALHEFARESI